MTTIVDLIEATVRLEQPLGNGLSTIGTGFIVTARDADGAPRMVLITANHVFARMPRDKAKVGFRHLDADGNWRFSPLSIRIRDAAGKPRWTRHPTQDVAAIELPLMASQPAVPLEDLPGEQALAKLKVRPGDEMMALGYPRGFAANAAGFPILRAGKVASFPLSPAEKYPTYLLDFSVFAGNSGGPVYMSIPPARVAAPNGPQTVVITGLLTQQIKIKEDRLAIGNVTQADFITETVSLMTGAKPTEVTEATGTLPAHDAPAASSSPAPSPADRLREAWSAFIDDGGVLVHRCWIVVRDRVSSWITPDAKRA